MTIERLKVPPGQRARIDVTVPGGTVVIGGEPAPESLFPRIESPLVTPQARLRVFDLGTQLGFDAAQGFAGRPPGERPRDYVEQPSELGPQPPYRDRDRVRWTWTEHLREAIAADALRREAWDASGGDGEDVTVSGKTRRVWPLFRMQTDSDTARGNVTLITRGERGMRQAAIAEPGPHWHEPATVEEQEDGYALVAEKVASAIAAFGSRRMGGLEAWREALDDRATPDPGPFWGVYSRIRVDRPGTCRLPLAPGAHRLECASIYNYWSWKVGDARWKVTEGLDSNFNREAVPAPLLNAHTARAERVDVYLVPQRHRIVTQWISWRYVAGWFGIVEIPILTTRSFSLRSAFWPEQFGRFLGTSNDVDPHMSRRLAATLTVQRALRANTEPLFFGGGTLGFVSSYFAYRNQGRFAVYTLPQRRGDLVAVLRFRYPESERIFLLWRVADQSPFLAEKIQISGFQIEGGFEAGVAPWIPNYFLVNARDPTGSGGDIGVGI